MRSEENLTALFAAGAPKLKTRSRSQRQQPRISLMENQISSDWCARLERARAHSYSNLYREVKFNFPPSLLPACGGDGFGNRDSSLLMRAVKSNPKRQLKSNLVLPFSHRRVCVWSLQREQKLRLLCSILDCVEYWKKCSCWERLLCALLMEKQGEREKEEKNFAREIPGRCTLTVWLIIHDLHLSLN